MQNVLLVLVLALLAHAAWRDISTRLIPDQSSLALLACGLALRAPYGPTALAASFAVAALLFILLFILAMGGLLGGGDVKLAGAIATTLPAATIPDFVIATAIAGGLLGGGYILAARVVPPMAAGPRLVTRVMAVEAWRIRRRGPLPYAVALAAGGTFALMSGSGV
ncbi:prepilin peptidase [Roseomonas sp. WA12]